MSFQVVTKIDSVQCVTPTDDEYAPCARCLKKGILCEYGTVSENDSSSEEYSPHPESPANHAPEYNYQQPAAQSHGAMSHSAPQLPRSSTRTPAPTTPRFGGGDFTPSSNSYTQNTTMQTPYSSTTYGTYPQGAQFYPDSTAYRQPNNNDFFMAASARLDNRVDNVNTLYTRFPTICMYDPPNEDHSNPTEFNCGYVHDGASNGPQVELLKRYLKGGGGVEVGGSGGTKGREMDCGSVAKAEAESMGVVGRPNWFGHLPIKTFHTQPETISQSPGSLIPKAGRQGASEELEG
ncbi:hypothetical protein FB45DRAFT_1080254 [Roridomyces roridus]|uniref:Zn(2)-C6 fungal-type domain-containing protein n=1 Tax=Roridomyces roridus TaxID=1738132 RepID=A0AAD7BS57_9AGAR|nr:hypothetical protein FB45DRAFT_1080254 [Roridomyces roridus]